MDRVIEELKSKNLLQLDPRAYVVNLDEYNMPPAYCKSDGATLYATRDLAAAFYRKKTYDFYKNLYVVAYQQNLHFRQFFKVIELMGYDWAKDLIHVNFGMVSMEEGTMSTRAGKVILLKDVLERAIEKTLGIIEEKNPELEDKRGIAQKVGVGAVIFKHAIKQPHKGHHLLVRQGFELRRRDGPYVQYYAREVHKRA
jgi:arginyl-tRNA synthetase